MLSQRKVLYLSILFVLFLSSCIPSGSPVNTPEPNKNILIPETCLVEGAQTFIASNGAYCFSYPFGYLVEASSTSDNIKLISQSVEQDLAPLANGEIILEELPIPCIITLQITYEDGYKDDILSEVVKKALHGQEPPLHTHLDLGNEKAELVKYIQGSSAIYDLYSIHGDYYYHFILSASSPELIGNPETALKLDKLFFTMLGSFSFLK